LDRLIAGIKEHDQLIRTARLADRKRAERREDVQPGVVEDDGCAVLPCAEDVGRRRQ
jgi:hypothetical protein